MREPIYKIVMSTDLKICWENSDCRVVVVPKPELEQRRVGARL